MNTPLRGALCFFFLSLFLWITASASAAEIAWIPKGRRFPLTFGDPREIRMAMLFDAESRIRASVGNYFNLLGLDMSDTVEGEEPKDEKLFIGIEGAGFFSLRQGPNGTFPLETMDGLFGFYFEMNRADWHYQIRLTHISAHLGDGIGGVVPIKYSRESLIARAGYSPANNLHVYGGFSNLVHSQPELPVWGVQLGAHYFFPWHLGRLTPFTAADIQWRDEAETAKWSINYHLGIALNDPAEPYHSFRFFYNYFSGADSRGQYLNRPFTSHSLGVEMQI